MSLRSIGYWAVFAWFFAQSPTGLGGENGAEYNHPEYESFSECFSIGGDILGYEMNSCYRGYISDYKLFNDMADCLRHRDHEIDRCGENANYPCEAKRMQP
jgi:hypothetical protein